MSKVKLGKLERKEKYESDKQQLRDERDTKLKKLDDYEKYESEVWKPVFEREILRNNHRWWAVTKIVDRNDLAYQNATPVSYTHLTLPTKA
mgnify:CR=1 FL=1